MHKLSPILIAAALLLAGAGCTPAPEQSPESPAAPTAEAPTTPEPTPTPAPAGETKTFTVTAGNFKYDVDQITVNKGDKVRIVFKNSEGFHDWVVDEFEGGRTKQIAAGAEETIEFVADEAGTFEYYCSVGKHRAMGMKGTLTVK